MKTPYELETMGWKITQIEGNSYPGNPNQKDYNIFHGFFFPYGRELNNYTLGAILEFIDNFLKEEQRKEETERFNLDR